MSKLKKWISRKVILTMIMMMVFSFGISGNTAVYAGSEDYMGEINMFAGNFAPKGWAFCQGQLLSIQQNTALFSILGTTYGGDGMTTFALPDLRGRSPVGWCRNLLFHRWKYAFRGRQSLWRRYKTDWQCGRSDHGKGDCCKSGNDGQRNPGENIYRY